MYIWLVTVRAREGYSDSVGQLLGERLLPLLREQQECSAPGVARCIHCAGEHTYFAYWGNQAVVKGLEDNQGYRDLLDELTPLLRLPPKRELWEVIAS